MRTGGSGADPTSSLLLLMFEKNGRPFPFVCTGFFEIDRHGLKDLIDLEGNGKCQLIRQSIDDGYWMTSLYQPVAGRVRRLRNIAGMSLPLYTRFLTGENHSAIKPPVFRHPFEPDLSNDRVAQARSANHNHIRTVMPLKSSNLQDTRFVLADGKQCMPGSIYGTMTVVLDERSGRRMASLSAPDAFFRLLVEINLRRLPVFLFGAGRDAQGCLTREIIFAGEGDPVCRPKSPDTVYDTDRFVSTAELP